MKKFFHIFLIFGFNLAFDNMNPSKSQQTFYEVILDRLEVLFEAPDSMKWDIKIKKVNKTRSFIGNITLNMNLGDNCNLEIKILKKQGGEYRYLPYNLPPSPFCNLTAKDTYFYPDFASMTDFPVDIANNCPITPGIYSVTGYTVNVGNFPLVAAQSGEYAAEVIFYENENHIGTYKVYTYFNKI